MARSPLPETVTRDGSQPRDVPTRSLLASLLISLRPEQWTKNLFVLAPLLPKKAVSYAVKALFYELDSVNLFLKGEIAKAIDREDAEAIEQLEKQLVSDRKSLRAECEEKKEKVRSSAK